MEQEYVLGIDLGTTSVKISIFEKSSREIKFTCSRETRADEPRTNPDIHEQNVQKIFKTLDDCLEAAPRNVLECVSRVAVCGQMHGLVMWQRNAVTIENQNIRIVDDNSLSSLITWQDSRCSQTFIQTLPQTDSEIPLSTGFGCVSLLWLKENRPEVLNVYHQTGTVQDLLVSALCGNDQTVMSPQNAASWGYFNIVTNSWEKDSLTSSAGFPVHLLPVIKPAGFLAGQLQQSWQHIPSGARIHVALGDFQCSVFASHKETTDAVVNISTSAQIAVVLPTHIKTPSNTIQVLPYFDQQFVATSAALTGGNSLDAFVKMLQKWMADLGVQPPDKDDVYQRLSALSEEKQSLPSQPLRITPTLWGERHDPCRKASTENITAENMMSLGSVWDSLCKGVIRNLSDMMPPPFLGQCGVKRIVMTGSALLLNRALQVHLSETFDLPITWEEGADAATGAALSVLGL